MAVLPVFSTPALVQLFEQTCNSAFKDLLPTGTTHVGFEFIIRHLRLVPVGGKVEALAEVAELPGKQDCRWHLQLRHRALPVRRRLSYITGQFRIGLQRVRSVSSD